MFAETEPREVDPISLTWWMSRRLETDQLPPGRVVVEFAFTGEEPTRLWLVLDRGGSVCTSHPGFDTDVIVTTDPVSLMRVFSGIVTLRQARASGLIEVDGQPGLVRQFPRWFLWSPFAPAVRTRLSAS